MLKLQNVSQDEYILFTERLVRYMLVRRMGEKLCAAGVIFAVWALLCFPDEIKTCTRDSIIYCLTALAPSMFPFMAVTGFAVNSGAGEVLGKYSGGIARLVFKLPGCCTAPIIMSFLGGYPAGARAAAAMLERGKIDEEQAGRMLLFCVNPGAAFTVTFLGGAVLGSHKAGWVIFLSVTAAGILLGILSGLGVPVPKKEAEAPGKVPSGALVRSVTEAAASIVKMCACIVIFSGFTAVMHGTGIYQLLSRGIAITGFLTPPEAAAVLSFLIEVTGGVGTAGRFHAGAALYAFGLAFGGACVHMQIFSFFGKLPTARRKFILFRFLHGALSAGCCAAALRLLPREFISVIAPIGAVRDISALSGSLMGGLSLVMMCTAFLLIAGKSTES